jgi:biopolymer transport protein ExbD
MNFRRGTQSEELEINFIPLIDVLLVIIIFLVVSTTFSKFSELKINLPTAEAVAQDKQLEKIDIVVTAQNELIINNNKISDPTVQNLVDELSKLKASVLEKDLPPVIINADSLSHHQSVINVMEASRLSGLTKITFATVTK